MWYLGQTVLRVPDNTPVIYLGIDNIFDITRLTITNFKDIGSGEHYTEDGGVSEWYPHKYTEILDSDGEVVLGNSLEGGFF